MSAHNSGSVQLLADRKCSLRIYQRDNHPDGGSSEARVGRRPDAALGTTSAFAGTHRRAGHYHWDSPARNRRSFLTCRHDCDCSRVSRHGLGSSFNLSARWHRLSEFWNLVAGGYRTGLPGYHIRCVAAELHQRRWREWNHETVEERYGPVDAAGLPAILDRARTFLRLP